MTDSKPIDIHAVLAERGQIAIVWSTQDVREVRPDLTDAECWEVLKDCESSHDANHSISWHTLSNAAAWLFGDRPDPALAHPITTHRKETDQ